MKRRRFITGAAGLAVSAGLAGPVAASAAGPVLHPATVARPEDRAGWQVPADAKVHVVRVTTLKTRGYGSLRDALQRTDVPSDAYRVIVFEVAGRIDLEGQILRANQDRTILAGQTAPGPIEIWGHTFEARRAEEQLFMHIAFRGGLAVGGDSWQVESVRKARFQNCSGANSVDEMMAFTNKASDQVCVVDSLIGFQLFDLTRGDHRFGPMVRSTNTRIGFYRNMFVGARRGMLRLANPCTVSCASNVFVAADDSPTEKISRMPMVLEERSDWPGNMELDFFQNEYIWKETGQLANMKNDLGVVTTIYERDNHIRPAYSALDQRVLSKPAWGAKQVDALQMAPGARLVASDEVMAFAMAHAGMRPAARDVTDQMIVDEVIAESVPTRTEAVDHPPPRIERQFFTPELDWRGTDATGRSNALVELDILHGRLGGVRRWDDTAG